MTLHFDLPPLLGVVPVFVNAGAALLPAVLAGIATVLGLLFKPRELLRLAIRNPWTTLLMIVLGASGYFIVPRLITMATPGNGAPVESQPSQDRGDWSAVALELIRQDQRRWRETWLEERNRRLAAEQRVEQFKRQANATGEDRDTESPRNAASEEDLR
jgi:hypothetical protein